MVLVVHSIPVFYFSPLATSVEMSASLARLVMLCSGKKCGTIIFLYASWYYQVCRRTSILETAILS